MAKTQKPNPIEEAIGERAKDPKGAENYKKEVLAEPIPESNSHPSEVPDEPTPTEMLNLEELNRRTEEKLGDRLYETDAIPPEPKLPIPASKSVPPLETKVCTPESPPQTKVKKEFNLQDEHQKHVDAYGKTLKKFELKEELPVRGVSLTEPKKETIGALDDLVKEKIPDVGGVLEVVQPPTVSTVREFVKKNPKLFPLAEESELVALRDFIKDSGFTAAGVAMHVVALCSQPMLTPSTTTWDFKGRANIPDMVYALLMQPGYIEGIWPSLKVVMADNKGNASWTAGVATSIAYFDVIRTLPTLKEMQNEKKS